MDTGNYSSIKQAARTVKNGRRSKIVQEFMQSKGIIAIQPEPVGSIVEWNNERLAIWKKKIEFQKQVIDQVKTGDARAWSWLSQLIDLSIKGAALEEELVKQGVNPITDEAWMRNQMMIAKLRENYDKAKIDLEKTAVARQIKEEDDNVLFTNVNGNQ